MSVNQLPPKPPDESRRGAEQEPKAVFSLYGLFKVISIICVWGAFANYAFSTSTPETMAGILRPLVVFSGVGLLIALAQLPLYYLAAYWIKRQK